MDPSREALAAAANGLIAASALFRHTTGPDKTDVDIVNLINGLKAKKKIRN